MRKAGAVLILALALLTVVSPHHETEVMVRLCGDDFYEACRRLTEESSAFRKRRDLSGWQQDGADSAKEVRIVRSRLTKRHDIGHFKPLALSFVKMTCCEVGCSERFMRYTCQ